MENKHKSATPGNNKRKHKNEKYIDMKDWLWYPYIHFGMTTCIEGDSSAVRDLLFVLAVHISKGNDMPFSEKTGGETSGKIIFQISEGENVNELKKKAKRLGGNPYNFIFMEWDSCNPLHNYKNLYKLVHSYNVKLIIIEPLKWFDVPEWSGEEVYKIFDAYKILRKLIEDTKCAAVIIFDTRYMRIKDFWYRKFLNVITIFSCTNVLIVSPVSYADKECRWILIHGRTFYGILGKSIHFDITDKGLTFISQL